MQKLKAAIEKYLTSDTLRKQAGAKGAITRLVNDRAKEIGASSARDEAQLILKEFAELPHWLRHRFTLGSLYQEGDRLFGWWAEEQVQAEELPVIRTEASYSVSFYGRSTQAGFWQQRGFYEAESFPFVRRKESLWVEFNVDRSLFWLDYGYALPCSLQWRWDWEGLVVTRSIVSMGFWQAWKWWDGARYWYLEKRPELFADMDWWGEDAPIFFEPPEDSFAVVLGVKGKEFWQQRRLSGEVKED